MHVILPTAQNTQVHKSSQNNLQSEILTMQTTKGLIYQLLLLVLCGYCRCHGDYVNQFIAHVNGGEKEVAEVELHLQKRSANILSTVSTFIPRKYVYNFSKELQTLQGQKLGKTFFVCCDGKEVFALALKKTPVSGQFESTPVVSHPSTYYPVKKHPKHNKLRVLLIRQ